MKISEVTVEDVADYAKLEAGEYSANELAAVMAAAKCYITSYTGIPAVSAVAGGKVLDDYEDLTIAYLVLCRDMYDNRAYQAEKVGALAVNGVVETILGMHSRNLV